MADPAATKATVGPDEFYVHFWGVRGSIACSSNDVRKYGGNTASLEIRCGKRLLLFDAGTGIRYLGNALNNAERLDGDLFFSHSHFDHICGLPFFAPFFNPGNRFRIWAGHLLPELTVETMLKKMMAAPLHPVPPEIFEAQMDFRNFRAGDTLRPRAGITVRTAALNHPDRATGYRVEFAGKSICYVTDTEHVVGQLDSNILDLIQDADIVIYDCTYTDAEFPNRIGWGHSTWQQGARLCRAAGVKTYVVFHHDPDHDDAFMDHIAREAKQDLPGTLVAREGMQLRP